MRNDLRREVAMLRRVSSHDGIVRLLDAFEAPPVVTLVLELCEGGDLQEVLEVRGALREAEARTLVRDVSGALAFMHARGIIHRDLKPENVMLVERPPPSLDLSDARAKLVDLGLARVIKWRRSTTSAPRRRSSQARRSVIADGLRRLSSKPVRPGGKPSFVAVEAQEAATDARQRGRAVRVSVAGTPLYMAPELAAADADGLVDVEMEGASAFALDAFSLGRMLERMLLGPSPKEAAAAAACCCLGSSRPDRRAGRSSAAIPFIVRDLSQLSDAARELIDALVHTEPEKRMAMAAVTQSRFVLGERI